MDEHHGERELSGDNRRGRSWVELRPTEDIPEGAAVLEYRRHGQFINFQRVGMEAAEAAALMVGLVLSMNKENQVIFCDMLRHYVHDDPEGIPDLARIIRDATTTNIGDTIGRTGDYLVREAETPSTEGI